MTVLYPTRIKKSNLGDILINALLIRELSKHGKVWLDNKPDRSFEELITANNQFSDNIHFQKRASRWRGLPVLRWFGLLKILPGLTCVFDPPGHHFENGKFKSFLKGLKYITRATILKNYRIKMVRLGVTMGPYSNYNWKVQSFLSGYYSCIGIRDQSNYQLLTSNRFRNLQLVDDLSFLYDANEFLAVDPPAAATGQELVIMSFRGAIENAQTDEEYLGEIIEAIKKFIHVNELNEEARILFTYQVKEDLEVIKRIALAIDRPGLHTEVMEEQLDLVDAIRLYRSSRFVLTNRLHVALLALLNDAPCFALTDLNRHHKLVNVFKDLQMEDFLMDIHSSLKMKPAEHIQKEMEKFHYIRSEKRKMMQDVVTAVI